MLRGGPGQSGYNVYEELRRDLRSRGFATDCHFSDGRGYYAVVDDNNHGGELDLGYGFGSTREEALRNALRALSGRDWNWSERRHGYRLLASDYY